MREEGAKDKHEVSVPRGFIASGSVSASVGRSHPGFVSCGTYNWGVMGIAIPLLTENRGAVGQVELTCMLTGIVNTTVIWQTIVNILPESKQRNQRLTSELPKLPSHRKVPNLQPPVRGETGFNGKGEGARE